MTRIALVAALSLSMSAFADGATLADRPIRAALLVPDPAPSQIETPELGPVRGSVGWLIGGTLGGAAMLSMTSMAAVILNRDYRMDHGWPIAGLAGAAIGAGIGGLLGYFAREGSYAAKVAIGAIWAFGSVVAFWGGLAVVASRWKVGVPN